MNTTEEAILLPIFQRKDQNDFEMFIKFWQKLYFYPLSDLYNNTINKKEFEIEDIQQLFIWKNGMKLSKIKQSSLEKNIIAKIIIINSYKNDKNFNLNNFNFNFKNLSAVWKIFLLHIIKPESYPIYDQHIHRAYNFIHKIPYKEISNTISNIDKENFYFSTYLPFIQNLKVFGLKNIDEAFFSFGQFINFKNNENLF